MRNTILKTTNISIILGFILLLTNCGGNETQFVSIGTGGLTGVYYPTGGAICRLANKSSKKTGVRCSVESTGGSIFNINAIHSGDLQMGIVQSDWQYHAYHGTSKFKTKGPMKELRSVFSVHAEPITVVARKDANIKTFDDLKDKRVNIGNPGSGQRNTMDIIMDLKGWDNSVFAVASELKAGEQSQALCDNKIDAMVYVVGHPSGSIKEATNSCDSVLINVEGDFVDKLVKENHFYRIATIPGNMYKGNPEGVQTFGVGATFVTSKKVSEDIIYNIVKAVFNNFDSFKNLHPSFSYLGEKEMIEDSLSAPLHRGAIKYYKQRGWI